MTDGLFSRLELAGGDDSRAGYRLRHIEVLNWGTFDKHVWRLAPRSDSALLTGDIGSGKSTLVDAVTTLLMPAHRIAYNKAAGADTRERSLRSYVEGHYKSERVESSGRSRAIGLRSGSRTYSVIVGVFGNDGYDETVTLAQVFQQREPTGQPYRFFVTARQELSIATDFADFGSDLRDLRKRLRGTGADIFDEFPKYATSLRRLLGIRSEQALELFHQTVSMKSVGNLNDFVRDHMLEPSDSSGRVGDIIAHFDDLTKAHDAVKRAREQLEVLTPITVTAAKYDDALRQRDGVEQERAAVRLFIAELRAGLLEAEVRRLESEKERWGEELGAAKTQQRLLADRRDALIEERAREGGDRIGELERLAREARTQAAQRRLARDQFDAAISDAGLDPITGSGGFEALTTRVAGELPKLTEAKRALDNDAAEAIAREKDLKRRRAVVDEELESLQQRTSNLPIEQVDVRVQLCADLDLSVEELPYAGEQLDLREEHAEWRGAAERVLRGFALSLLVPQRHYEAVAGWVNGRRLTFRGRGDREIGARLTYVRVPDRQLALQPASGGPLALADCIQIKDGPFTAYLSGELGKRADHRCARTLEEFRTERRAVTRAGQVRSGDRHDKDDRHDINDPRRWVLGWANERKIAALRGEIENLDAELAAAAGESARILGERDTVQSRLQALARLEGYLSWSELDADEAVDRATSHDQERARLAAGSSRLVEIGRELDAAERQATGVTQRIDELTGRLATTAQAADSSTRERQRDLELISAVPEDECAAARSAYAALHERLRGRRPTRAADCASAESALSDELYGRIERLGRELGGFGQRLVQDMGEVLRRWPELRADLDAAVESRGDFVALRERVAGDDLPRFETEFKHQLNKNAIQELAGFNNWLGRQAAAIDERVGRINEALGAVPYNPGRYIRLEKEPTSNQEVAQFRGDLRNLTNDSLRVDGDQYSEQRFLDVQRIIERFRGRDGFADSDKAWTRRVTDVRNWFVFSASERDRDTHVEWEHYSDSDGKSGGQKEKLAYTILAASLAYQFGLEWGAVKSKDFRFAVIDEAFGRGSDASTRYALELFDRLGLQLLIVTPLQKVHIIEPYVKAIGFVDNPDGTFSRLYTMTIEEYRARRDGGSA
ncbi:ATP-binding protein [Cumulibacter manganitolerans]|uniref:ATP-binding protein n=1 Tax=Cumulibacter manganitolerans TaxID=1884992 RepID=UPI00129815C6|nr:ATP-binding protein [Cumulibacter manganitolerans]